MDERELSRQVELAGRGDPDALQRLIVHYQPTLRGKIAAGIDAAIGQRLDPEDVLQQVYISAFNAIGNPNRDRQGADDQIGDRQRVECSDSSPSAADQSRDRQDAETTPPRFDGPAGLYKWLERIALNELKNQRRALQQQKRDINREIRASAETRSSYPDLVQRLAASQSTPSRQIARDEAIAAVMSSLARLTADQRAVVHLRFLGGRTVAEVAAQLGKTEEAVHALCYRGLKALRESMVSITHYLSRL